MDERPGPWTRDEAVVCLGRGEPRRKEDWLVELAVGRREDKTAPSRLRSTIAVYLIVRPSVFSVITSGSRQPHQQRFSLRSFLSPSDAPSVDALGSFRFGPVTRLASLTGHGVCSPRVPSRPVPSRTVPYRCPRVPYPKPYCRPDRDRARRPRSKNTQDGIDNVLFCSATATVNISFSDTSSTDSGAPSRRPVCGDPPVSFPKSEVKA